MTVILPSGYLSGKIVEALEISDVRTPLSLRI
jgi:hypothetical protein